MTLSIYCWNLFVFSLVSISGQFWTTIPNFLSVCLLLLVQTLIYRTRVFRWTIGMVLAILSVTVHGYQYNSKVSTLFQAGENITINGRVDSYFKQISHGSESTFLVEMINGQELDYWFRPKVKILLPEGYSLEYGERWLFKVRIKPVYGRLNESGFDQEKYYASQGWGATAIVKEGVRIETSDSYRNTLHLNLSAMAEKLNNLALLKALSFGDRNDISPDMWKQLRSSGLTHLVAISGLHIGIAYFIGWNAGGLIRAVGSLAALKLLYFPVVSGIGLAFCYSWLAGFSITTQRAFTMCLILSVLSLLRLSYSPGLKLLTTLSVLLLLDPFSSMSSSFWLSFSAVAIIFVLINHPGVICMNSFQKAIVLQVCVIAAMIPVSLLFFGGMSSYSPLYNFWAVPYFSFFVVPSIFISLLVSTVSADLSELMWKLSDLSLKPVVWSITVTDGGWHSLPGYLFAPLSILILSWLLRPVVDARYGILLLMISLYWILPSRSENSWRLDVLDVGQGLAVLIEKEGKHLLYDTGNRWYTGSIAESVIAPILYRRGVRQLDILILSHLDSDHAGGKTFIENEFKPKYRFASQFMDNYSPCIKGVVWSWQRLKFEVLWPPKMVQRAYNPHSCVIKVSDSDSSILFTGDIELISEYILIRNGGLESDLMLVPHHGSRTSSSAPFVTSVSPQVAIASLAKGNRWGMPHEKVLQRYNDQGVEWIDTGEHGQISVIFSENNWKIEKMRENQSVTWYRQMLRKGVE